jgi:hypothetical protein
MVNVAKIMLKVQVGALRGSQNMVSVSQGMLTGSQDMLIGSQDMIIPYYETFTMASEMPSMCLGNIYNVWGKLTMF